MIRPGLEEVSKHGGGAWMPEDVYSAIKVGQSHLHIFYDDSSYEGFVVTTPMTDYSGVVLHVWGVFSEHQNQRFHDCVNRQLDAWARNIQAKKITFSTTRKGWERVGKALGFYPTVQFYEKEVE